MNPALRQTIARIDVLQDGGSVRRGTGTLVADGLVLTALHVVADRQAPALGPYPGVIRLTFPGHITDATIRTDCYDAQSDWVLLECAEAPRMRPMPLAELDESHVAFETFGFPDIQPQDGMVQSGRVENHDAEYSGTKVFQLFSQQAAAGDGAPVDGASGSPIIVGNALVAVMRSALLNQQRVTLAGTLYACPVGAVLDRCGDIPVPDPCRGLPGLPRGSLPAQPFTYLNRFSAADAEIFFGRCRDIRDLLERLTEDGTAPLVLLYGQAGVGKSSFLDAGVRPRLEWTHTVRYARHERNERLLATVIRAISATEPAPAGDLGDAWRRLHTDSGRPPALILDQVEEIYTSGRDRADELTELLDALAALFPEARPGPEGRVVLSFRKEWLSEIQQQVEERGLSYGKVFLGRLDRQAVVEIVTGLTRTRRLRDRYGLRVDARLADLIADDLQEDRDSPIAPTLRILLTKMWEQAIAENRASPLFTAELYQRLKREGLLLGDFLDRQIALLADDRPSDVSSGLAIDVLAFHTSPLLTATQHSPGELQQRYPHRRDDLAGLIQEMKRRFLLVDPAADQETHAAATRLAHDTLAPLVRQRFDESDRPGQRARRILESRAVDWRNQERGTPLDDGDLATVERGLPAMRAPDACEERLLAASRISSANNKRRRRAVRIGAVVAIALIVISAGVALVSAVRANQERRIAIATARTVQAREALETDPTLAAAIFAELQGYPEPADGARTAHRVLSEPIAVAILRGHAARLTNVVVSPDDQRVVTTSYDGTARIWPLDGSTEPVVLSHVPGGNRTPERFAVLGSAFDPSGTQLATYSLDQTVRLWNRDGTPASLPLAHPYTVDHAEFDQTGRLLLTTTAQGGTALVWNVTARTSQPLTHAQPVVIAHFRPAAEVTQVLTVADAQARVWTLRDESSPLEHVVAVPDNAEVTEATFSADGKHVLVGTRRGSVLLLPSDGAGAAQSMPQPSSEAGPVQRIRVAPDGRRFAIAWMSAARLWDVAANRVIPLPHPAGVRITNVVFNADARIVGTVTASHGVWLWPVTPDGVGAPRVLRGHERVGSIDFSRNGFVVTGSADGTARVWSTTAGYPEVIAHVPERLNVARFDTTGTRAVVVSGSGVISLWKVEADGASQLASTPPLTDAVADIRVADGGSHILALSNRQLHVWQYEPEGRRFTAVLRRDRIAAAAFAQGGQNVVVVETDGSVRTGPIRGAWPVLTKVPVEGAITLALAAGSQLLVATGREAVMVDLRDGHRLAQLMTNSPIIAAAFTASRSHLATATMEGLEVHEVRDTSVPANAVRLPSSGEPAAFVMFSGDGSRVLTLDVVRKGRLFSSSGSSTPLELTLEDLRAATFSSDGTRVLGLTVDGRLLRWRTGWHQLIAALAGATTACLTGEQRMQFLGEAAEEARGATRTCRDRRIR